VNIERRGNWFYFDDHDKEHRWCAPVPGIQDCGATYDYLIMLCPTTRDAAKKLAAIRRAYLLFPDGNGSYSG
jgi:hypothetical protein